MNDNYAFLENLEAGYTAAETAPDRNLPDGKYSAILDQARLIPPDEKRPYPRFSVSWIVTEGAYKGRLIFMSYNFNEKGFPYFKKFCQQVGITVPQLRALPDLLPRFTGRICELSLVAQRDNPQYQNAYCNRLLGTGRAEDYRKQKPTPGAPVPMASETEFTELNDDDDLPFD